MLAAVLAACGASVADSTEAAARPKLPRPVALVPLAPKRLAHCRASSLMRPACPTRVPRVRAAFLSHLYRDPGAPRFEAFNLERGGESPTHPERNRPPRMAHIVIFAGAVERGAPFRYDAAQPARLANDLMSRDRTRALAFGPIRWANRNGRLYLAPPVLHGGMMGNHLIFRWRDAGRRYALGLHAWEPLLEASATLRAIIASLPRQSR
jgi:hypothetical protein